MLIFTDASYSNNTKVAGFGFVIIENDREFRAGNFHSNCKDNNVAEIGAIASALEYCERLQLFSQTKDRTLTIITDSRTAEGRILTNSPGQDEQEQKWLKQIQESIRKSKLKTRVLQIKGHNEKDSSKFSQYNALTDWIAGDYRYLGEIERRNQKVDNRQVYADYANFMKKKNRRGR